MPHDPPANTFGQPTDESYYSCCGPYIHPHVCDLWCSTECHTNALANDQETSFVTILTFFFDELTFQRYLRLRIYHCQLPILTPMCLPYSCTWPAWHSDECHTNEPANALGWLTDESHYSCLEVLCKKLWFWCAASGSAWLPSTSILELKCYLHTIEASMFLA